MKNKKRERNAIFVVSTIPKDLNIKLLKEAKRTNRSKSKMIAEIVKNFFIHEGDMKDANTNT